MANEQTRENKIPEPTQSTNEEQVVLIHDKKENKLNAVSKIDKDGNFKSVPFDEKNQNSFLKINPSSGILESFFKNFWSQAIEPTRFRLLSFTEKMLKTKPTKQILTNITKGNLTKEVDEFIEKFLLTAKNFSKNRQNSETSKAYRFTDNQIDWKELGKYGITKEYLAENGLLEQLLMGKKTDERVPITMKFKSCQLITALPVSLNYNRDGKVELKIHGISKEPTLNVPFFGHTFTKEDRENLLVTGNMGRVVDLDFRNGPAPAYISLNPKTNEVVAIKAEYIHIPEEVKGVKLTPEERKDLADGKPVFVKGMISERTNKPYEAVLQVSAIYRGIGYKFDNTIYSSRSIGGVELDDKQINRLRAGRAILVKNMTSKKGNVYSNYVAIDQTTGQPLYTRYNPDAPEDKPEIYVDPVLKGATLSEKERLSLQEGNVVFVTNMIDSNNEEYSQFVKFDLRTGIPMFSDTPDGFTENPIFQIPQSLKGVTLSMTQRAGLQNGEVVRIDGIKCTDGSTITQYAVADMDKCRIKYYDENPDHRQNVSQQQNVHRANYRKPEGMDVR